MRVALGATLTLAAALLALRLGFAALMPIFVDEAWYAWCARYPALAYSDLPGLTAWTLSLVVDHQGATPAWLLRLPTVLAGCALPLLVLRISSQLWPDRPPSWLPAMAVVALPLATLAGVLALPDAWLLLFSAITAWAALAFELKPTRSLALLLGLTLGLALATHPRALVIIASLALYALLRREMRAGLCPLRGALIVVPVLLGLLPTLVYNWQHELANLRFQWVDRHAFAFSDTLFLSFWPIQIALAGPLWVIVTVLGVRALRGPDMRRQRAYTWAFVLGPLLGWWLVGSFADRERLSWHWTLSALVLAAALWPVIADRHRRLAYSACALGIGAGALLLMLLAAPADRVRDLVHPKLYPRHFAGWDEIAAKVRAHRKEAELLVADNFMLAAQLAYQGLEPDAVLDHSLNATHGRALQPKLWGRDEAALGRWPADTPLLVVLELTNTKTEHQPAWTQHVLGYLREATLRGDYWIDGKRFVVIAGRLEGMPTGPAPLGPLTLGYAHVEQRAGTPWLVGWLLGDDPRARHWRDHAGRTVSLHNCAPAAEAPSLIRCFYALPAQRHADATLAAVEPAIDQPVRQWVD